MAKAKKDIIKAIPDESIISKIYVIREQKVMLDMDLAELYEIDNKQLKRQIRRNIDHFPEDFMIELKMDEYSALRSQFGTINNNGFKSTRSSFIAS